MGKKSRRLSKRRTLINEALTKTVDFRGGNPDPAVNALVSDEFLSASNFDATEIALMLQQIVRGQDSLLAQQETTAQEIARLRERQDKIDRDIAARLESQRREIQEILDRAEKLKATGMEKDKIIANGAKMFQEEVKKARARLSVEKLQFEEALAREPKELIISPGQLATVREGGQIVSKILPEEVRIKHKRWVIQPGVPTEVPRSVAEVLRNRRKSQEQTDNLKGLLGKQMNTNELAEQWNKQGGAESMPLAPT